MNDENGYQRKQKEIKETNQKKNIRRILLIIRSFNHGGPPFFKLLFFDQQWFSNWGDH